MEWQITFVLGMFVGWFGRGIVIILFDKYYKKKGDKTAQ